MVLHQSFWKWINFRISLFAFWYLRRIHVDIFYVKELKQAGLPTCLAVSCQPQNYSGVRDVWGGGGSYQNE